MAKHSSKARQRSTQAKPSASHSRVTAQGLIESGQLTAALELLLREVAADPQSADAHKLLAIVAVMQKRPADASSHAARAVQLRPDDAQAHVVLGRARKLAGELSESVTAYRRAIELDSRCAEAHVSLGIALKSLGDIAAAVACHRQAIAINPGLGVAHANLGMALAALAEQAADQGFDHLPTDDLLRSALHAVQMDPRNSALIRNYGALLMHAGRRKEAADRFNEALGIDPTDVESCLRLGACLRAMGDTELSIELCRRWLSVNAPAAPVMRVLSDLLTADGRVDEAICWAEDALALDADAPAMLQLAVAYQQCRRLDDAVAMGLKAIALSPKQPDFYAMLLLTSNYLVEEPETIFDLHARFGAVLKDHVAPSLYDLPTLAWSALAPGERLKVGYVSGDFALHSVSYFISALLEHHDRSRFELVCYHNRAVSDLVTDRLKALGHAWVDCFALNDLQFSRRVRADGVHVLIDLAGHTSHSRVNALALRAAPVQIGYLGYPTISGVETVDYRITDAVIDSGDAPERCSELPLCLPRSMFCYRPPSAPDIGPPPVLHQGVVTFGSFNNVAKLSDHTLRLWAQVLHSVPGAVLLLKSTSMVATATHDNIVGFMAQQGIASDRLKLVGRIASQGGHLDLYNQIDIALDPVPYNGATTTCEALWMGVPVVTLRGRTHASRMGASILCAVGKPEWIAACDGDYVATASRLATDVAGLAQWRGEARTMLAGSELCDESGYTTAFEALLRRAWAARGPS